MIDRCEHGYHVDHACVDCKRRRKEAVDSLRGVEAEADRACHAADAQWRRIGELERQVERLKANRKAASLKYRDQLLAMRQRAQRAEAALAEATAEAADLRKGLPSCTGEWVSGSGGHRVHAPCPKVADWWLPDDSYAYCDEHYCAHDRALAEKHEWARLWPRKDWIDNLYDAMTVERKRAQKAEEET